MRRPLLSLLLALLSPPLHGYEYAASDRICVADIPRFDTRRPIPIGCEVVDCCPGCPGTGPVELRINVDSRILSGAELTFEGLKTDELARLRVAGKPRPARDRLLVAGGTSRVHGLVYNPDRKPVVARIRPLLQPGAQTKDAVLGIRVAQYLGQSVVNNFDWRFDIRACLKPPPPAPKSPRRDALNIVGIPAGEEVVVMMDVRTLRGCEDGAPSNRSERIFRSAGRTVFVHNLLTAGSCNSEIAVFSRNHAMALVPGHWTNVLGDERTVTLAPPIEIAVNIWVPDDATLDRADTEMNTASTLYADNMVGVLFKPKIRKFSESATPNASGVVHAGTNDSGTECHVGQLRTTDLYTANTLNVYYVNKDYRGRNCAIQQVPNVCTSSSAQWPAADANMIFIGESGSSTTLTHEIGHAFGLRPAECLGHTDSSFGPENIMAAGGGDERKIFTLGQVFRMNTHDDEWGGSMLVANGDPTRPKRACLPNRWDARCPALKVDR